MRFWCVFAGLLGLVMVRGAVSLAEGRRSVVWPFGVLLAMTAVYEVVWLRFVNRSIQSNRTVSGNAWTLNSLIESLVPTVALFLEIHTSFVGPDRALSSPVVLTYLLFIMLSALHLNPGLSRLTGVFSMVGYLTVSIYVFLAFPEESASASLLLYGTAFSSSVLLLLGGFATGAVAQQIRTHVLAALHEAESRSRIARLEHDLDIARSIQQELLPKAPPRVRGFEIAGWNQPADETGETISIGSNSRTDVPRSRSRTSPAMGSVLRFAWPRVAHTRALVSPPAWTFGVFLLA